MGWKDRSEIISTDDLPQKTSWKDRSPIVQVAPPDTPENSPITAATTGIIQGAIPFAGAISGAAKTGLNALSGVTGPLGGGSLSDIYDDYERNKNEFSEDAKKAGEAHPGIALAGNIAGGLTNPLFRGAETLPQLAGASGVQALGMSDADLTKGEIGQAAKDTVGGALGGVLGYGVGKALPSAIQAGKYLGKKALTNFGPTSEAIEQRFAGRAKDALDYPQLAENMGETIKDLGKQTRKLDDDAWSVLSEDKTIPKDYLTAPIDQAIEEMKVNGKTIGGTDKSTTNTLQNLKDDLSGLGDEISESDMKQVIRKMDDNINWDDQSQAVQNNILKSLRNNYDTKLKDMNPTYKGAMDPVAQRAAVMDQVRRLFNLQNVPGKGLQPTDTTATKIQSSLRDNKAVTQGVLDELNQLTGKDYQDLAKDYQLSQQFEKTGAQGSKRTNLGAALGGGLGYLAGGLGGAGLGTSVGGLAGATMDAYGGKVAGAIIDTLRNTGSSAAFGKFAPVIEEAAKKGPQALAVTGSILSQNPEFKQIMDKLVK